MFHLIAPLIMWKNFFYFSKRERRGIVVLLVFIAGIFLGKFLFTPKELPPVEVLQSDEQQRSPLPETQVYEPYKQKNNRSYQKPPKQLEKRTYYQQPEKPVEPPKQNHYPQTEKIAEGTTIELNSSDTTQLMKIPGIGSSFAKRIISYRNKLNGYYRIEQLQEVYGMYEELYEKIKPYITINPELIQALPVNSASVEKLKTHPYINFYQAKVMVDMRKKKGKLESINELSLLEEFTKEDWERIEPYLKFE
jgi:competence ComEA-like helix-hairpin-helix protein